MAYFLGRDVVVAITSELTTGGVCIDTDGSNAVEYRTVGNYDANDVNFAGPQGDADTEIFGATVDDDGGTVNYTNEVADLVGCDLGIGVTDEDITYMGQKSVLKAEIKKETTVSLTRKKKDNTWDLIFNKGGRYGIPETAPANGTDLAGVAKVGMEQPDFAGFGYRVYIQLKSGTEIFAIPNACITGHTVSLNADGTTEETLEFMSYVDPIIGAAESDVRGEASSL